MDHPVQTHQNITNAYTDAWHNEQAIKEEGWNLFLGKLEDAVDNYHAHTRIEEQKYVSAAAGIAKTLGCNAAATDACAAQFSADVMGFEACMSTVPGCLDGVVSVDWGDMHAKYSAIEKLHGGIDLVSAKQWDHLAEVYNYGGH